MARRKLSRENIAAAAQKWAAGYTASGPAIQAGVQNPRTDPTQAAIAQQQTLLQNFNAAVSSGAWANGLRRAGLGGWQAGMMNKTIPSLGTRATAGQPHYQAFLNQWAPALEAAVAALPARGDFNANKQRASAMMDWQHQQRGKYRKLWRGG